MEHEVFNLAETATTEPPCLKWPGHINQLPEIRTRTKTSLVSHIGSQDDSHVEPQRCLVLLVDLLLPLGANFAFGLQGNTVSGVRQH